MARRSTLSRAGITDVYKDSGEVLRFPPGGRLLHGVNGSGVRTRRGTLGTPSSTDAT